MLHVVGSVAMSSLSRVSESGTANKIIAALVQTRLPLHQWKLTGIEAAAPTSVPETRITPQPTLSQASPNPPPIARFSVPRLVDLPNPPLDTHPSVPFRTK